MDRNALVLKILVGAVGFTTLVLIAAAHEDVRNIQSGFTAQRNIAGVWQFLMKTTQNVPNVEQSRINVEVMSKQTNNISWIERISIDFDKPKISTIPSKKQEERVWPSPPGYTNIAGLGYYKVYREKVVWETARRRCAAEGAHLLIINSALEAAVVVAANNLPSWTWLGFDDYDDEGEYVTLHSTTLEETGYTIWAKNEPTKGLRCGVADENGLLGTGNCMFKRNYVCEFHSPNEHVLETRLPMVPMGYRAMGNLGFYRVRRDRVKWETARRRCAAEGAHLMVPNTAEEAAAVLRTSELPGWFWVGFDDFRQPNQYINFDGQQLKDQGVYSNFASGEPDGNLHCGVARTSSHLGTGNCDLLREYICELNKPNEIPDRQPPLSPTPPAAYQRLTDGSYYKVHRDKARWETARRRCADEGAHLLVINSQDEADAVVKTSGLPSWFWLGFDDFDAAGEYVYFNGTRLVDSGYVRWANKEPTENLNCGVARDNGLLGTGNCNLEREYICEWEIPSGSPPVPSPYPPGYHPVEGFGVYKVHRERVHWESARRRCAAEGAHLLVLNSKAEADAVVKANDVHTWTWVGFDDFSIAGDYVTVLGTSLQQAGYSSWAPKEPDPELRCGVIRADGLLGTGNCRLYRVFICEL